ncbi:MAG: tetratricopeptide repeat protein [Terracidiphilus sp.]|jgi:tetratricopeptide (TPR) repeat protein
MARSITKSIAVVLQIVLGLVLVAILGLLSGLLTGDPAFLKWINAQPWYSPWNAAWATVVVVVLMIAVAIWQYFASKDADNTAVATREDVAAIRKMLEGRYESAISQGLISEQALKDKDAEITRLTEDLRKLQEQVAARFNEPSEAKLSQLLKAGDLDAALRLKSQQVQARREESAKLPRDLFELGIIHELRFDWPQALAAYREAWELDKNPEHGFQYAVFEQRLNHFNEAIVAYEMLLRIYTEPSDRATTLNNLAVLYRATQHIEKAEQAYDEALATYRKLAKNNPEAYLPGVATTLNNLAIMYSETQRLREAEQAYDEALAIRRKLAAINPDAYRSDVAIALINLAVLYRNTQRPQMAEQAHDEALTTFSKLAKDNPAEYLPYVAITLNNLVGLYNDTNRPQMAEQALGKAFTIYQKLAEANPDTYRSNVAMTLNNLAILYGNSQRTLAAERAYNEALAVYRDLAEVDPDVYLPYVALTLNNLANLDNSTGRTQEAETHAAEAERILESLWQANHELHGDNMARILGMRALVAEANQQPAAACAYARRARAVVYDTTLKQRTQKDFDRLCPESLGQSPSNPPVP